MADKLNNILIIKPSSLGDIVLALPALSTLRRSFPGAKISWLIRTEFAPVLKNHPDLNDIILFDRKFLSKAWFHSGALASLRSLILGLRRSKFDAVIDLQGLFRTGSLAWVTGCKRRFGMTNAREFANIFYTHKIPQDRECTHLVDYYLRIVRAAGASEVTVRFVLPQDHVAADSVGNLLKSCNVNLGNYAVFAPCSSHRDKCWPAGHFASLADKIASRFGLSIVATGTASERSVVEELKNLARVPIANFGGVIKLNELVALLRGAKLVVSNDTGPGHIAAALGGPLVMIFGPSNPIRLFPYRRPETVAAVEPFSRGSKLWSSNPAHAIEAITVDDVYEKICGQIK
jgi:lipopolysaccharide heptosyltransferase I